MIVSRSWSSGGWKNSTLMFCPFRSTYTSRLRRKERKNDQIFLLQNKQGKTRLSKWYATAPEDCERAKMECDIHRVISLRVKGNTNFVEFRTFKIIYRRYAGLYFVFGVDGTDNELLFMETVHLFVQILDEYFSNVCELDIVFHFNKVYALLDEFILAGEVQESSKKVILSRIRELEQIE